MTLALATARPRGVTVFYATPLGSTLEDSPNGEDVYWSYSRRLLEMKMASITQQTNFSYYGKGYKKLRERGEAVSFSNAIIRTCPLEFVGQTHERAKRFYATNRWHLVEDLL
jgi:hypothetical protein